jgi:hypothetical protein
MIKKLFIVVLYMTPMMAMQNKNGSYTVSQKCYDDVQEILRDRELLYVSFNQTFKYISTNQIPIIQKPSDFVDLIEAAPNIDDEIQLEYGSLTWYLKVIVRPHCAFLDKEFDMQHTILKDAKKTWTWFTYYFKNEGLRKPIACYCVQLIEKDQALCKANKLLALRRSNK